MKRYSLVKALKAMEEAEAHLKAKEERAAIICFLSAKLYLEEGLNYASCACELPAKLEVNIDTAKQNNLNSSSDTVEGD